MFSKILSKVKSTSVVNRNITMEDIMIDITKKFAEDECLALFRKHLDGRNTIRALRITVVQLAEKLDYDRFTVTKLFEDYLRDDNNTRKQSAIMHSLGIE